MKYSTIILALVASVFAIPQDASITSAPVSIQTGISAAASCVADCKAGDVNCQAACIGSAHPLTQQVLDTNACAAKCDQGDGSKEATQKFSDCTQACISGYYLTTGLAGEVVSVPVSIASSLDSAATSLATSVASKLASGTNAVASTGTGAVASSTPTGAANSHTVQIAGAGLAGFIALFAL